MQEQEIKMPAHTGATSKVVRDRRLAQLEAAYRLGMFKEFTQIPGTADQRLTWDVETHDGHHHRFLSRAVPFYLAGLADAWPDREQAAVLFELVAEDLTATSE